jgi:hypothetical protein
MVYTGIESVKVVAVLVIAGYLLGIAEITEVSCKQGQKGRGFAFAVFVVFSDRASVP